MDGEETPKQIGQKSEAIVMVELVRRNITVLQPFGDSERYDLVVDSNDDFHRLQVKTARIYDGRIVIELRSTGVNAHSTEHTPYTEDEIDFFAGYCFERDETYIIPVEETGNTKMTLRFEEADRHYPKINWADNYKLENQLGLLRD